MMKRFSFRLDKVLDARRLQEQQTQRRLAEAQHEKLRRQKLLEKAESELSRQEKMQRRLLTRGLKAGEALINHKFRQKLSEDTEERSQAVQESEEQVFEKRTELTKAMQRRKVLESLRERRKAEYKLDVERTEQNELDDNAARCHHNNNIGKLTDGTRS